MAADFEKNIRDAMNNPPDFPFDENLWKDMEHKLNRNNAAAPSSNTFKWLPLLLLLLMATGLGGYFYSQHNAAIDRIVMLEQRFDQLQTIKLDTIVEKHVTIIYDTIYKNISVYEGASPNTFSKNTFRVERATGSNAHRNSFFNSNYSLDRLFSTPAKNDNIVFNTIKNAPALFAANAISSDSLSNLSLALKWFLPEEVNYLPTRKIDFLKSSKLLKLPISQNLTERKKRKGLDYYLLKMQPKEVSITAFAGGSNALNIEYDKLDFNWKIEAEIGYGKPYRLVLGAEALTNKFDIILSDNEEENLSDFPILSPDHPGDELLGIYGNFRQTQVLFGMKYYFLSEKRFQPYLGLGMLAHKILKSQLRYEYLSALEKYDLEQNDLQDHQFEINDMWSSLGFRWKVNTHWSLLMEASTQLELKKKRYRYENHNFFKWNAGLQYQF